MKKKYTKKQITEAIAYWKKQLRAGNYKKLDEAYSPASSASNIELELDCTLEKPYKNNRYVGSYTHEEFEALCQKLARKYDVKVSVCVPGVSVAEATITVSGPEQNVRKFYQKFYAGKIISNAEWQEAKETYGVEYDDSLDESCGYEHKVGHDIAFEHPNGSFLTGVVTKVYKDQNGKVGGYEIDVGGKKYKVDCEWVVG